jgi:hypothetical protein
VSEPVSYQQMKERWEAARWEARWARMTAQERQQHMELVREVDEACKQLDDLRKAIENDDQFQTKVGLYANLVLIAFFAGLYIWLRLS